MPLALATSATVKLPTAVSAAPVPSFTTSVATEPLVLSDPRDPELGTAVSVHWVFSVEVARLSLNVVATRSTFPFVLLSSISSAILAGAAASAGAAAANDDWLPAASRIPLAPAASATVKLPTAVSAAPAPSVRVSVAMEPLVLTLASVPPLGTLASVHCDVSVELASVSLNVTVTRSTFPLAFVSNICIAVRITDLFGAYR